MSPVGRHPGEVLPCDAFLLPPMFPRSTDLVAGGGFGVVLSVNAKRGYCYVAMENGTHAEIDTPSIHMLRLEDAPA